MSCDYLYKSKDYGLYDCCPEPSAIMNAKMSQTYESTYYFSYAAGIRKNKVVEARERLNEPKFTSELGVGFDLDSLDHIRFHADSKSIKKEVKLRTTFFEKFLAYCKLSSNFVALSLKAVFENFLHFKPPGDYLDNIKNENMNNLTSIDYAVKDFT